MPLGAYSFFRSHAAIVFDNRELILNHDQAMNGNGGFSHARQRTFQRKLGLRIQKLRRAKGLSRQALAQRLEVSPHSLKKWELGVHAPPLQELVKLLGVLEVTFEELVLGRRPPALPPGQRNELAVSINRLMRAARPLLQPPEKMEEE
jgi:transcriptional regulator with XRE-family HTH domain